MKLDWQPENPTPKKEQRAVITERAKAYVLVRDDGFWVPGIKFQTSDHNPQLTGGPLICHATSSELFRDRESAQECLETFVSAVQLNPQPESE